VRWIVAPNCFHHLGVVATAAHYKRAKVVGPRSVVEHNKRVELHMEIGDDAFGEAIPEIERVHLTGCPFLDETVFFHRPTGSLIGADLLISASPKDHWTWRWAARVMRCYERVQVPPDVRKATARSEAVARAIESMAKLPIERILVAHCDPIVNDPVGVLENAWRFARPDSQIYKPSPRSGVRHRHHRQWQASRMQRLRKLALVQNPRAHVARSPTSRRSRCVQPTQYGARRDLR
jgi:hypothetical protein